MTEIWSNTAAGCTIIVMPELTPTLAQINQAKKERAARMARNAVEQSQPKPRVSNVYNRDQAAREAQERIDAEIRRRLDAVVQRAKAQRAMDGLRKRSAPTHPAVIIQNAVADYYRVSVQDMHGRVKLPTILRARWVGMYLMRTMLKMTFAAIGKRFGGKDHATVIHGIKGIVRLLQADPQIVAEVDAIKAGISL